MTVTLIKDLGTHFISERSKTRKRMGLYSCDFCGTEFKAMTSNVKSGKTVSCGCYRLKKLREAIVKHGMTDHRLYETWKSMKNRCYRKGNKHYHDYGGRGITVCDEWLHDFQAFYDWSMVNGYADDLTIDRIDNNKGYCPSNCRFTDTYHQAVNKRKQSINTSGYIGVSFSKAHKKWVSYITVRGKRAYMGYFNNAIDAAKARDDYINAHDLPHTKSL